MQRQFEIPPCGELHAYVPLCDDHGDALGPTTFTLKAVAGDLGRSAEVFGAEMVPGTPLTAEAGANLAIYSHTGCSVVVEGPAAVLNALFVDTVSAGRHRSLVDVTYALAIQSRQAKQEEGRVGPCVLVCGTSSDCGKSTVARTLANYSVRLGYQPMLLDMDTASPSVGMPNCISAYNLQYPMLLDEGAHAVPGQHVYVGPAAGNSMLSSGVGCAMALVENRWAQGDRIRLGGLYVDYPTVDLASDDAVQRLRNTLEQCNVDTLVIVGASALKHRLLAAYDEGNKGASHSTLTLGSGQEVAIITVEQAAGAARRNRVARDAMASRYWEQYFYGTARVPLQPTEIKVPSDAVWVLAIVAGGDDSSLQTMMSLDHADEPEMSVMTLNPAGLRAGTLLALSDTCFEVCDAVDPYGPDATYSRVDEETVYANLRDSRRVLGYVKVVGVSGGIITILSPCAVLPQPRGCCFVTCSDD